MGIAVVQQIESLTSLSHFSDTNFINPFLMIPIIAKKPRRYK